MKFPPNRSGLSIGLVSAMAAILVVLALLQYRWSGQVSEAYRERMQIGLDTAVAEFRQEFQREMIRVCLAFRLDQPPASADDWKRYAPLYDNWVRTSLHRQLVAGVFIWDATGAGSGRLLQVDGEQSRLHPVGWPAEFAESRKLFEARLKELREATTRDVRFFAWTLDERVPALYHALLLPPVAGAPPPRTPRVGGYIIVKLDMSYIQQTLLPQVAKRHFSGPGGFIYRVQVAGSPGPGAVIYRSEPAAGAEAFAPSDAEINLFGPLPPGLLRLGLEEQDVTGGEQGSPLLGRAAPLRAQPVILPASETGLWRLSVKHRYGSLDEEVVKLRWRNLAAGFGVLTLLAISMAMIIVSTGRAQRLAKLQVEFTAGVSHELRTPLAVICSAGDNLADGVVASASQVKEYGELIRVEGRRLRGMVDQILLFASGQSGRSSYDLRPVNVAGVIDAVLAEADPRIRGAGVSVEKTVEPALPPVRADAAALTRCLHNLVDNALKYGGDRRWVGVRAGLAPDGRGPEVRITVEDKGLGIEEADLQYIFEPFYRGSGATASQIHGTGLGLSLARDMVEAMGGTITVSSSPGKGSAFTLHLPALDRSDERTDTSG